MGKSQLTTPIDEFQELMRGCRTGDERAISLLVQRYLPHVRLAVRRHLAPGLRARFDSQDFTQDVWVSFLRKASTRAPIETEGALIGYLTAMARLKVHEEYRHQMTQTVGLQNEIPLEAAGEPAGGLHTPSALAIGAERWEQLTTGLAPRDREMLEMIRDGHTHAEIALAFDLSTKTVQRLVGRLAGPESRPSSMS